MKFTAQILIFFILVFSGGNLYQATEQQLNAEDGSVNESSVQIGHDNNSKSPLNLEVILKRNYLNGEFSEEIVHETIYVLEDFWAKYEQWQLVELEEDYIVFEIYIDDISPLLKLNGFFGLTDDGTLTIFNGIPKQEDIIQSFFQIDIKKLEGKKHLELKEGIPIKSKEVFAEVLETMRKYSLEES